MYIGGKIIIAVIIAVCLWLFSGLAVFCGAMSRGRGLDLDDKERIRGTVWERWYDEICTGIAWIRAREKETVSITSNDGLQLFGDIILSPDARGTVILFHGYRTFADCDFSADSDHYYSLGYNLLYPDQRGCSRSGGRYITFGLKERFDCARWAWYVSERFGEEHEIFLGGLSLGASTVLMASGEDLPKSVKGIIADSAFTSPADIIERTVKNKYHLPARVLMPAAGLWSRLLAGVSLSEYSTIEAMEKNTVPVLFVHGKADDYVPWEMTVKTAASCRAPSFLFLAEGAEHGTAYMLYPEEYRRRLTEFFEFCSGR